MTRGRGGPRAAAAAVLAVCLCLPAMAAAWAGTERQWIAQLEANPADRPALEGLARLYGLPVAAVPARVKADRLAGSPRGKTGSEDAVLTAAGLYESIGQYSEAREVLGGLLARQDSWRATLLMGWENYLENRLSEALRWYEQAVAKDPGQLDGYHGLMLTLMAMGRRPEAAAMGNEILRRDPRNLYAHLRLGQLAYEAKDYPLAIRHYGQAAGHLDGRLGLGLALHKMRRFAEARPHLLAAQAAYPAHPDLLAALRDLNEEEIRQLEHDLSMPSGRTPAGEAARQRLAALYELNGHFLRAADWTRALLPPKPSFDQLLRVAGLYGKAGRPAEAGRFYELAAAQSPNPRLTWLAAVDSYLASKHLGRAELLLSWLVRQAPGADLDQRYASLLAARGQADTSRLVSRSLSRQLESRAAVDLRPADSLLQAVDASLNAREFEEARRQLARLGPVGTSAAIDARYGRLFYETGAYDQAVKVFERHEADPDMQVSCGWAWAKGRHREEARKAFRAALRKVPNHAGALAGLYEVENVWPWDAFLILTSLDYHGYQDNRLLTTEVFRYTRDRWSTTVSHTRTDVPHLTPGSVDFNEDLAGVKFRYRFRPKVSGQLHLLHFENDDPNTDSSNVVGARFWYFPTASWTVDVEFDRSRYTNARANQISLHAGYRFNPRWHGDLTALFTSAVGPWRWKGARTTGSAVKAALGYSPHQRWYFGAAAWGGTRLLAVDSDGMYAYNVVDLYRGAWSLLTTYRFETWLKGYLNVGQNAMRSNWQAAANAAAGAALFDPEQRVDGLSGGLDFSF